MYQLIFYFLYLLGQDFSVKKVFSWIIIIIRLDTLIVIVDFLWRLQAQY